MPDFNVVVVSGRLAAVPEVRAFAGGATLARYLITTVSEGPRRRIDVVPVVHWDPGEIVSTCERGDRVWVAGSVQRRFWRDGAGTRSGIEIVAHHVERRASDTAAASEGDRTLPMVEPETPV